MKDNSKILIIVVGILLVVVMGVSFAYFAVGVTIGGNGANTNITTGDLPLVQYDAGTSTLSKDNLMPNDIIRKSFKVIVTPTKKIKEVTYRIFINITNNTFQQCTEDNYNVVTNDCEIGANELVYRLKDNSGNIIKEGDLTRGITGEVEIARETKTQDIRTEYEYIIEIEYKETNKDQNHNANKMFNGEIKVEFAEEAKTIDNIIATLNPKTEQPDFSQVATTDEGVYQVSDGMYGGTSYYWRGAATTNYLKFAGFCWRIVRINGDKTIRLIYDGTTCHANGESTTDSIVASNQTYNANYNQSNYVGWTYVEGKQRPEAGDTAIDSNAKTQTENWHNANIGNNTMYASKVTDGKYCNDRGVQSGSMWGISPSADLYYAANKRVITDRLPALVCSQDDTYTLEVGAITADEVMYAGGLNANNISYYLYNGQNYWTMSPSHWGVGSNSNARVFYVRSVGYLSSTNVSSTTPGLRPVINLKSDVLLFGEGTIDNPYQVIS